jgi:hypothetical protein
VVGAKVAVGAHGGDVEARVAAGEDARARVCVRAASVFLVRPQRCRSVSVQGLRSLDVDVRAPNGTTGPMEVAVRFAAESNQARKTLVVRRTVLRP